MFPDIETISGGFDEIMENYSGVDDDTESEIYLVTANLAWNGDP